MSHALAIDSQQVALDLHALLKDLDPARWRDDFETAALERLSVIRDELYALREAAWSEEHNLRLKAIIEEIYALIQEYADPEGYEQWMALRLELQPAYESLAVVLEDAEIHVPSLRPTNYTRNVFHVLMGIGVMLLTELVLDPTGMILVSCGGVVWGLSMELSRRRSGWINDFLMRVFGPVAHPHETHRINSATWYTGALLILALFFTKAVAVSALIVLAFGDPAAALIGRRWGKTKLIHGRSLEGSLAFVAAAFLATWAVLAIFHPTMPIVAMALTAAVFGAVGELVVKRIDDNLAIPVAAAFGASIALQLLT